MSDKPKLGTFGWLDLTVPDAPRLRDFYAAVCGWTAQGLSMGDYEDYVMMTADGTPAGGVCHARGANAKIPPAWIPYVVVEDLAARVETAKGLGATIIDGPRSAGGGTMCILKDPAGAVFGMWQG